MGREKARVETAAAALVRKERDFAKSTKPFSFSSGTLLLFWMVGSQLREATFLSSTNYPSFPPTSSHCNTCTTLAIKDPSLLTDCMLDWMASHTGQCLGRGQVKRVMISLLLKVRTNVIKAACLCDNCASVTIGLESC